MTLFRRLPSVLLLAAAAAASAKDAPKADALTRQLLRDTEFQRVAISPDGSKLAFVRRIEGETPKSVVSVHKRETLEPIISFDPGYGGEITSLNWADDQRMIIGATRIDTTYNMALFNPIITIANLDGTRPTQLPGRFHAMLEDDPDHFLIYTCGFAKGAKGCAVPEIRKTDLKHLSSKGELVISGPPDTWLYADAYGRAGAAFGVDEEDGTTRTYVFNSTTRTWKQINDSRETKLDVFPISIRQDGSEVLLQAERSSGPDVVETYDPATGVRTPLYTDAQSDPVTLVTSFDDKTVIGAYYDPTQPRLQLFKPDHPDSKLMQELQAAFPGRIVVPTSRSKDRNLMVLRVYSDRDPGAYYLFDRKARKASMLARRKPWIDPEKQAPQRGISFKSRDGEQVHGLLTVPPGSSGKNLPLVVLPHGGPLGIVDSWGYDRELQILGQHGYAVLQVNFRGSGGYGRRFQALGERQWGLAMQDDLTDATRWAISEGIADAGRVCIYGASYGGYAAVMGVIREPNLYRCAVGVSGVYNLERLRKWGNTWRSDLGKLYISRILGDDMAVLKANSPVAQADRVVAPVLLMHGTLDARVPVEHALELQKALRKARKPAELVQFSRTGHTVLLEQHELEYYARLLEFLDDNIGPAGASAAGSP